MERDKKWVIIGIVFLLVIALSKTEFFSTYFKQDIEEGVIICPDYEECIDMLKGIGWTDGDIMESTISCTKGGECRVMK